MLRPDFREQPRCAVQLCKSTKPRAVSDVPAQEQEHEELFEWIVNRRGLFDGWRIRRRAMVRRRVFDRRQVRRTIR